MKKTSIVFLICILCYSCSGPNVILEKNPDIVDSSGNASTSPLTTDKINIPSGPKRILKLKSALIKGGGDITPAAKVTFVFRNYSLIKVMESLSQKNNAGIRPYEGIKKYKNKNCRVLYDGGEPFCDHDTALYYSDVNNWFKTAYNGIEQEKTRLSGGIEEVKVKTDLSGEADVELNDGIWYVTGHYKNSFSDVIWKDIKVIISKDNQKFELSNDNGEVFNLDNKNLTSLYQYSQIIEDSIFFETFLSGSIYTQSTIDSIKTAPTPIPLIVSTPIPLIRTIPTPTAIPTIALMLLPTPPPFTGTATPAPPTNSSIPLNLINTPSAVSDIVIERTSIKGRVYDVKGNLLDNVIITAKAETNETIWAGGTLESKDGSYLFQSVPVSTFIFLSAEKSGYIKSTRLINVRSNLSENPLINTYDFNSIYALSPISG